MEWMHIKIQDEADEPCQSICVKKEYCIGCSACAKKLPSVFAMEAKKAIVRSPKTFMGRTQQPRTSATQEHSTTVPA